MIDLKTYSDGSYNEPDYYLPETTDIDLNKNILKYIENNNRVLIWDSSSGGAGDFIVNGGQPGDIIIKSTDGGDISIGNDTYNGLINIGSNSSTDNIHLNGGLEYQFDKISTSNNGPGSFLLGVNHYIIEVTNTLVNNIQLPSCLNTSGRVYIQLIV